MPTRNTVACCDVQRTIRLWEEAGASGLHLEGQALPKKCGHFAGKQLVSQQEVVQKLHAMLEARQDPAFFVVARTDAIAVNGLEDAIVPGCLASSSNAQGTVRILDFKSAAIYEARIDPQRLPRRSG